MIWGFGHEADCETRQETLRRHRQVTVREQPGVESAGQYLFSSVKTKQRPAASLAGHQCTEILSSDYCKKKLLLHGFQTHFNFTQLQLLSDIFLGLDLEALVNGFILYLDKKWKVNFLSSCTLDVL